eukprot:GHVR01126552.1.p1 GENE.GHVR01126552.1~~GHVR01126552.1.p1  ORF type:complete len:115 (-),score=14.74 GHVR01126552.1:95-439(-)
MVINSTYGTLETDGLVWVVDSADTQRLEDCKRELQSLLKEERLSGATLLIFANKQDLAGALDKSSICQLLDLESIGNRHWGLFCCSATAMTSYGLLEGISFLVGDIASRIFSQE